MKRKSLFIFAFVLLFIGSFALPCFASSNTWTQAVFNSYSPYLYADDGYTETIHGTNTGTSMQWNLYPSSSGTFNYTVAGKMSFSVDVGDRVQVKTRLISGWFGGTQNELIAVRYVLCYFDDDDRVRFIKNGKFTTYSMQGGQSYAFNVNAEDFYITDKSYDNVFIGIQFQVYREPIENVFSINYFNFHYGFGDPTSPNAPIYNKPSTDSAERLEDIENDLLNDSQGGINTIGAYFNNLDDNLSPYLTSLSAITDVMNLAVTSVPFIHHLINISLILGVFAFLLNIAVQVAQRGERVRGQRSSDSAQKNSSKRS